MNLEKLLKSSGKNITPERLRLGEWMKTKHLFTSSDIENTFSDIGRASIFRSVKLFSEIWYLRKIQIGDTNSVSYEVEHAHHHHEHMKCNSCGDIISFESENICKKLFTQAKKIGFQISEHSIWILGTCKKCI